MADPVLETIIGCCCGELSNELHHQHGSTPKDSVNLWEDTGVVIVQPLDTVVEAVARLDAATTLSAPLPSKWMVPPFAVIDAMKVTALLTGRTCAIYLGTAQKANPTFDVVLILTTALLTITWAEIGIAVGASVSPGSSPSLTTVGVTDVSGTMNGSTGPKTTQVTTSGVARGDEVWLLVGSQASTPMQFRGGVADESVSMMVVEKSGTRPSTMAPASSFLLVSGSYIPPAARVRQF